MPEQRGAIATVAPVTCAAATVSVVMYPLDVCRALVMSNPGGVSASEAITSFVRHHGLKVYTIYSFDELLCPEE